MSEYIDQDVLGRDDFYGDFDYADDQNGAEYDEYTASYGCHRKHHRPCFTKKCCHYYRPNFFQPYKYCKPVICKCYPIYKDCDRKRYDCDRYDGGGFSYFGMKKRHCGCWGDKY